MAGIIINDIKTEIMCAVIIIYVGFMYYAAQHIWSQIHRTFSVIMQTSLLALIFESLTLISLHNENLIPRWLENLSHRIYLASILMTIYMCYMHIKFLINGNVLKHNLRGFMAQVFITAAIVMSPFLPMVAEAEGSRMVLTGAFPNIVYILSFIYMMFSCLRTLFHWKEAEINTRITIVISEILIIPAVVMQYLMPRYYIMGYTFSIVIFVYYISIENIDVILLRQLKVEKQRAEEAGASKLQIVSAVSNEIRTPMSAITGVIDLMLGEEENEEKRKYLLSVKRSVDSLAVTLDDIIDRSKIEAGKIKIVDKPYKFIDMLEETRMIIENKIDTNLIKLEYDIDNRIPEVIKGDSLRMRQIIINLLKNTIRFVDEGIVILRAKLLSDKKNGYTIRFSVCDSGHAIKKEDLEKLLNTRSLTDESEIGKGDSGYDLSISADLISLMGGRLEIKSDLGKGSELYFTLFQKRVDENELRESDENEIYKNISGIEVLLIDDTELNLEIEKEIFGLLGANADTAASGEEAFEKLNEKEYDMIFVDYIMPEMNGAEFAKKLRSQRGSYFKKVPIIAILGDDISMESKEEKDMSLFNDYAEKPIDVKKLLRITSKWLDKVKH